MQKLKHALIVSLLLSCVTLVSITSAASAATLRPRTALLYQINRVRALHGVAPVYPSAQLQLAANHHSDDMMMHDYFAHTSPTGSSVYSRITASGFVNGYNWVGGETLAWGTGTLATPLGTVNAWLASPEHRSDHALTHLPLGRHQPHLRHLPRPHRRMRLDGRLGQALLGTGRKPAEGVWARVTPGPEWTARMPAPGQTANGAWASPSRGAWSVPASRRNGPS